MKIEAENPNTGGRFSADIDPPETRFFDDMRSFRLTEESLRRHVEKLNISADAKHALFALSRITLKAGEYVIRIGRKIIDFILRLFDEYPNMAFGALFGAVVGFLFSSIPVIGFVLGPVITPLAVALGLAAGYFDDMRVRRLDADVDRKIREFEATLAPLRAQAA